MKKLIFLFMLTAFFVCQVSARTYVPLYMLSGFKGFVTNYSKLPVWALTNSLYNEDMYWVTKGDTTHRAGLYQYFRNATQTNWVFKIMTMTSNQMQAVYNAPNTLTALNPVADKNYVLSVSSNSATNLNKRITGISNYATAQDTLATNAMNLNMVARDTLATNAMRSYVNDKTNFDKIYQGADTYLIKGDYSQIVSSNGFSITLRTNKVNGLIIDPTLGAQIFGGKGTSAEDFGLVFCLTNGTVVFSDIYTRTNTLNPVYIETHRGIFLSPNSGDKRSVFITTNKSIIGMGNELADAIASAISSNTVVKHKGYEFSSSTVKPVVNGFWNDGSNIRVATLPLRLTNSQPLWFGTGATSGFKCYGDAIGFWLEPASATEDLLGMNFHTSDDKVFQIITSKGIQTIAHSNYTSAAFIEVSSNGNLYFSDRWASKDTANSSSPLGGGYYSVKLGDKNNSHLNSGDTTILGGINTIGLRGENTFTNKDSASSNATVTFVTNLKMSFTPSSAGYYDISVNFLMGVNNIADDIVSKITINGTNYKQTIDSATGTAGNGFWISQMKRKVNYLTATPQIITLQFARNAAVARQIYIKENSLVIRRVK